MSFAAASKQDYHALLMMLDTAYACIRKRAHEARATGDAYTQDTAQRAMTALLEAILESLNTHIDSAIGSCAMATKPTAPTVADHRATRESRLVTLEERFGFKRDALEGWAAVKLTNDQTNAIKHRLGLTLRTGTATPLAIEDAVELDERELLARMDDVHAWVLALGEACQLH